MVYAPPSWQIDPKAVKRIAVFTVHGAYCFMHADPRTQAPRLIDSMHFYPEESLCAAVRVLLEQRYSALWLLPNETHPNSSDHPIIRDWPGSGYAAMKDAAGYDLTAHEISSGGHLAGLVFQRMSGGIPFGVYAPWVGNAWGIDDLLPMAPDVLAEGLALAAYAMGAQLRFSPSYTGLSVLRDTLRGVDLPQMSDEWAHRLRPARLGGEMQPSYIQWRRDLPVEWWAREPDLYSEHLTLYKYDRTSSFMASARELPVGDPIPTTEFMPHLPGVYKITSLAMLGKINDTLSPGPFRYGVPGEVGEYPGVIYGDVPGLDTWAWEPQVRLARKIGCHIEIEQGYYWPREQRRDFMRDWQQRVWAARCEVERFNSVDINPLDGLVSKIASRIIKKAGVTTIGRLNQNEGYGITTKSEARERGYRVVSREVDDQGRLTGNVTAQMPMGRTDLYLPAVWSTIIANANERLQSLSYAYPGDTVLQYVDAAYMLHRHPEIEQPRKLGKFKLERTLAIPVADLEHINIMSPYDLTVYLAQGERDISFFEDGDQEPEGDHGE